MNSYAKSETLVRVGWLQRAFLSSKINNVHRLQKSGKKELQKFESRNKGGEKTALIAFPK